jgi:uncharacterized protein YodC (DUF2158 family)
MMELKVGDVVVLKSGSVPMTVEFIDPNPDRVYGVNCIWFDDKGMHHEKFSIDALTTETTH